MSKMYKYTDEVGDTYRKKSAYVFDFRGGTVGGNKSEGSNREMSVLTEASDLEAVLESSKGLVKRIQDLAGVTYDGQNRLAEYRYFYKPDKLSSGYKFQY